MTDAMCSSETSVLTRATRRLIPVDGILHSININNIWIFTTSSLMTEAKKYLKHLFLFSINTAHLPSKFSRTAYPGVNCVYECLQLQLCPSPQFFSPYSCSFIVLFFDPSSHHGYLSALAANLRSGRVTNSSSLLRVPHGQLHLPGNGLLAFRSSWVSGMLPR
jgi:hypothetical protein